MFLKRVSVILLVSITTIVANAQYALYQLANSYADSGNYQEAIRIMKNVAEQERETEYYIEDIASIARFYSYTEHIDSLKQYNYYTQQLAEKCGNDSIAEIYIQSTAWNYYLCNQYENAIETSKRVLELREKIFGLGSEEWHDWLGVIKLNAFKNLDFENLSLFSQLDYEVARNINGIESRYFQEAIAMIRAYGHQYVNNFPDFVINWIEPYYQFLKQKDILKKYQYEFEILLYEAYFANDDLKNCQTFYNELNKWTYPKNNNFISIEDRARIWIKLAHFDNRIGNPMKARWRVEEGWKLMSENIDDVTSLDILIDRCNVERILLIKPNGEYGIYSEWLLENITPLLITNELDDETLASLLETRAWAYEGIDDIQNAIADLTSSIKLKPLLSRQKKLAQLYLVNKEYERAETIYLKVLKDAIGDTKLRKSIESDLLALYWEWNKIDKLENFIKKDFENITLEIRNVFAFMNDFEREKFLSQSSLDDVINFDVYTTHSSDERQWAFGNQYAYNLALIQKGLLLNTSKDIEEILTESPDSLKKEIDIYNQFRKFTFESGIEDPFIRDIRLKLMEYVSKHPDFLSQLNYKWEDVRKRLHEGEIAIEFVNLLGLSPEKLNKYDPCIGALLLKMNSEYPIFVKLSPNFDIESVFKYDEEGMRMDDEFYSGDSQSQLYSKIWEPLLPYLKDIKTIYYSPTGLLQTINLDWLGTSAENLMVNKFNLYRLSSTREICHRDNMIENDEATLYGDITYALIGEYPMESSTSKYRSITRSGFSPLSGTKDELDSIQAELQLHNFRIENFRKSLATEKSFREFSGNSPKILHIATHGFYFSEEKIIEEFKKSNFIGFQATKPELYHSGLALAGAQDTWINEYSQEGIINFNKYFNMDGENDGILLSSEISQMDLSGTELVVLSACETALGEVKTEGVYGLQRAFKLAGVKSILMSLWKVDDDATQLLMSEFYKNLLGGKSKRLSLLEAQKTVRETPGYEEPYYWAAFILLDALN